MFLKLPFAVSISVLFLTIQYAVFRNSFRTFCVSLYIYEYTYMHVCVHIYDIYIHICIHYYYQRLKIINEMQLLYYEMESTVDSY